MKTYKTKSGKTYTKKQICEAISFWKKQLKKMNEGMHKYAYGTFIDANDVINNPKPFPLKIAGQSNRKSFDGTYHIDIYLAKNKNPQMIRAVIRNALIDFYDYINGNNTAMYIHPKTHKLTHKLDIECLTDICSQQFTRTNMATFTFCEGMFGQETLEIRYATEDDLYEGRYQHGNYDAFKIIE